MAENNNNNGDNMNNDNHQQPPSYSQLPPMASSNPQLRNYWIEQMETVSDFKNRQLPLARIKKIMKADPDVHMVSAEAPIIFAKACEMFIVDLTMRSWLKAEENKRHTLQKSDISNAVASSFTYDFLLDVVPKDESIATADPGFVAMPHPDGGGVPQYYYPPGVVMGTPMVGSGMYAPSQAWPAAAGDGEDDAEDNGGNGGGN
ncbi:Nuclear transcription factor Y subunit C-6 [Arabidopsis thaliana]|uniref:Nuclear transcription factor Y subunit C-6 n=6 Tax=Arabidopsis TaxID=3701 RepID=NFYC6_ARATH|nr:nuclear factor Y, subunit C6 [Arabidopsis thaliana]Q9FGP7.1 RecName: Full=Nuclear transcription factor Y subunit C-6; Short=AtNF-YC-6 [Arabidopsis thaliana]KAG7605603.1 Transcription factor CBF/NF-Y/archaeal histone domain [Arabidopsis thaliana x Arabidopsis arenosa]KAG7612529.1 Transcription factor CBF/NF-Y/archaeal histone domain [Arabidopsis suecica]AAT41766.1 At5g50480 [Arabidopsis thaliana]AAT70457.1 At5g50480 [Arabidopsis thaliana]AED95950.1 nuclear factor Y, subunit C6 [Arabidopsis |eukprot:NP_199859.1 nuclear factor Y, subunit C6 [Arabidopsis thaliana]